MRPLLLAACALLLCSMLLYALLLCSCAKPPPPGMPAPGSMDAAPAEATQLGPVAVVENAAIDEPPPAEVKAAPAKRTASARPHRHRPRPEPEPVDAEETVPFDLLPPDNAEPSANVEEPITQTQEVRVEETLDRVRLLRDEVETAVAN